MIRVSCKNNTFISYLVCELKGDDHRKIERLFMNIIWLTKLKFNLLCSYFGSTYIYILAYFVQWLKVDPCPSFQ
jgi:hypothetical protein